MHLEGMGPTLWPPGVTARGPLPQRGKDRPAASGLPTPGERQGPTELSGKKTTVWKRPGLGGRWWHNPLAYSRHFSGHTGGLEGGVMWHQGSRAGVRRESLRTRCDQPVFPEQRQRERFLRTIQARQRA